MFRLLIAWLAVAASACFSPTLPAQIQCSEFGECPPGLVCRADLCVPPGPNDDAGTVDAAPLADGAADASTASCGVAGLRDDFSTPLADRIWTKTEQNGATIATSQGELLITFGGAGGNASVTSTDRWSLASSEAFIELTDSDGGDAYFALYDQFPQQGLYFGFTVDPPRLVFEITDVANGIPPFAELGSVTFSPSQHRFWKVRDIGGVVVYEVSSNGTDWTQVASYATNTPIDSLALSAGALSDDGGTIRFDDLNGGGTPMSPSCNERSD